jgi:Kinesin motor domain
MELNSILRIRPLRGKEKEDHVVLEKANAKTNPNMAVLHPLLHLTSPDAKGPSLDFIEHGQETDYHFDKILDISATQESVFYAIGLNMVNTAMEPLKKTAISAKNQLLVAMGMPHAGKSYTTFGGKARVSRNADDGLVPRMLDSLYSQSKHHIAGNKVFGISIQLIHIYKEQATDLLVEPQKSTPSKKTRANTVRAMVASFETTKTTNGQTQVRIDQDGITGDFVVHTSSKICRDAAEAREVIATGISRSQGSKLVNLVKASSKGHVVITLQPVLTVRHEVEKYGGIITIVDMAGEDKNKVSQRSSSNNAMRDAIGPTSSSGAVLHCLRGMQHNQNVKAGKAPAIDFRCGDDDSMDGSDISNVSETKSGTNKSSMTIKAVPFRQSPLTMVLQPLFAHKGTTLVTLLMAAYPGHRDYADKRSLLNDLEILQGAEVAKRTIQIADTGLVEGGGRVYRAATPVKESESDSDDDLVLSDEDQESDISAGEISFEPLPPPVAPSSQAVAPRAHTPVFNGINDLPGVTIPGTVRSSTPVVVAVFAPSAPEQSPVASAPSAPLFRSPDVPKSSSVYMPSPPMNPNYRPASPVRATVSATPVIRPPAEKFENQDANSPPHRNWMTASPLKTITSAVNSTKKKGMKALEKMEKMVPERMTNLVVTNRMSHEFEPDVSQSAMMKRIKELEDQNARLLDHNSKLGQKCDELQEANNRLVKSLKQADKHGRRAGWTEQEEVEWQKSRRKQLNAQQLIRSPLRQHLKNVQTTYEINNRWTDAGKPHFSLDYPKQWRRARELDERDRTEAPSQPEPMPPSFAPSRLSMQPSQIGDKRKSSERERTSKYVKPVFR